MRRKQNVLEKATLEELVDHSLDWMLTHHYSPETIKSRRIMLRGFLHRCHELNLHYPRQITTDEIEDYMRFLRERRRDGDRPLTARTIQEYLGALRVFFRWLVRERLILSNPLEDITFKGVQDRLPGAVLTAVEVERIMAVPDLELPSGLRDRALLELMYSTGMRRFEISGLMVADVHLESETVFIREGKGRKDRLVPAGERAVLWIRKYLADGRNLLTGREDPGFLFLNLLGRMIKPKRLTDLVGGYVRRAGVGKPGSCHLFRHTAATLMLENGADIRHIQEMLGHESADTTQIYTRVSIRHMRETHRRTHPTAFSPPVESQSGERGRKRIFQHQKRPYSAAVRNEKGAVPREGMEKMLYEYLDVMRSRGFAEDTVRDRRRNVLNLIVWLEKKGISRPNQVTLEALEKYQKKMYGMKKANGDAFSIARQRDVLIGIRAFFKHLCRKGKILYSPAEALVLPRRPRKLPVTPFTREEVEKILSLPDVSRPFGLRDRTLIELLYATGMRVSELIHLKTADINHENGTAYIRSGKGGKSRIVPLGKNALYWLERYLDEIRPQMVREPDPGNLFLSTLGERISVNVPRRICGRYKKAAGIEKPGSCHNFRHTAATLMLENGADIRIVQEFLGHKNLRTTQIYTHVNIRKLREVHARTHPAGRRLTGTDIPE